MRTIDNIKVYLQPLEDAIRNTFLQALFNGYILLLSLLATFGGLGIMDPAKRCNVEYENSRKITENMVTSVKNQNQIFDPEIEKNSNKIKNEIKKSKAERTVHC